MRGKCPKVRQGPGAKGGRREGQKERKSNMLDKTAEKDGRRTGQNEKERVKMTVETKKKKTDKCTEKWCGRRIEREVKAYEWMHYSRREEKITLSFMRFISQNVKHFKGKKSYNILLSSWLEYECLVFHSSSSNILCDWCPESFKIQQQPVQRNLTV